MTTSTTPAFGFPYPEGDEYVIGGDDAIEALAKAVEGAIAYGASVTIAPGESAQTVGGATAVEFPGAANFGGFTRSGNDFIYDGPGSRFFIVAVSVEVDSGGVGLSGLSSTVQLLHNGTAIQTSHDDLQAFDDVDNAGVVRRRKVVHGITTPVHLGAGEVIGVTAYASPAGDLGVTSLRIYPIGPRAL